MKYEAVIFDMDGLLLDTETISISTFVEACKEHSFKPDLSVYHKCIGVDGTKTREIMSKGYGSTFPLEAIFEIWKKKMDQETIGKPIPLKTGALSLLTYLEEKDIRMAVVTSTRRQIAQRELSNANIGHFFDFVVGGDEVMKGKPDPEIYMISRRKLNNGSTNLLVLEDSDNGVVSAFNAGLKVIQIPDIVLPSVEVKALGHNIMKSLAEVETELRKSNQSR